MNNNTAAGRAYNLQFTASGYTVTGNSIALTNAGDDIVDSAGGNSINTPFTLDANSTFNISAGTTTLGGELSVGVGAITKTGAGTLPRNSSVGKILQRVAAVVIDLRLHRRV